MASIRTTNGGLFSNDRRICGQEIEYGLLIEGRNLQELIDDSADFVSACPAKSMQIWDQEKETSRSDLRGFVVEQLEVDPEDQKFGYGKKFATGPAQRADRILSNGGRFYNDHGHPEYSTPECFSAQECSLQSLAGEYLTWQTGQIYQQETDREVTIFKNNTDFHGSTYGTHESFLAPRQLGWENVMKHLLPVLISRQVLSGAGKVGCENNRDPIDFQLSQRADFFEELASVNTLWKRPVFNTRDEAHADPAKWMRIHVITPDANRIAKAQMRGMWLIQIALRLIEQNCCPFWGISDAPLAFRQVSRGMDSGFIFALSDGNSISALEVLATITKRAIAELSLDESNLSIAEDILELLTRISSGDKGISKELDWMAKRNLIQHYLDGEGMNWTEEFCQSLDLEYAKVDPVDGLFQHLQEMEWVIPNPTWEEITPRIERTFEATRAAMRGYAIEHFPNEIITAGWERINFVVDGKPQSLILLPNIEYDLNILRAQSVEEFISQVEQHHARTT